MRLKHTKKNINIHFIFINIQLTVVFVIFIIIIINYRCTGRQLYSAFNCISSHVTIRVICVTFNDWNCRFCHFPVLMLRTSTPTIPHFQCRLSQAQQHMTSRTAAPWLVRGPSKRPPTQRAPANQSSAQCAMWMSCWTHPLRNRKANWRTLVK